MLKRYFLLLTILITSASFAQNINQKWMFESIRLANDTSKKNLKPIADGDLCYFMKTALSNTN